MQTLIQAGYITRKGVTLRYTPQGTAVCDFKMGVGAKDDKQWWKVTCWGKTAEFVNEWFGPGSFIIVTGQVNHKDGNPPTWEGNNGTMASFEMTARNVDFGPRVETESFEPNQEPENDFNQEEPPF